MNDQYEPKLLIHQFIQSLRMRNCSERTIRSWDYVVRRFVNWCSERGIQVMEEVTHDHLAAYRRHLFHYRNPKTGNALKFDTQAHYLTPVRRWFGWMKDQSIIENNPADNLELPKPEERLPTGTLSAAEVETLLNEPDTATWLGLRDRAILETLYSTGIRASELTDLDVYDINAERKVAVIRQGKNKKDRVVPIGTRALTWINKWTEDIRPDLVSESSAQALFVSKNGHRMCPNYLSYVVRKYLTATGVTHRGSCHLLRHTAATLMMENGADLFALQMFLGHSRINTTQIYTHVSIKRLQEIHRKTHPGSAGELKEKKNGKKNRSKAQNSTGDTASGDTVSGDSRADSASVAEPGTSRSSDETPADSGEASTPSKIRRPLLRRLVGLLGRRSAGRKCD